MTLTDLDNVRKRPGMYVGDCDDGSGALNLVLEVLSNTYDHYLAGACTRVSIELAADGTIAVTDDGPGIPGRGSETLPALDALVTTLSLRPTVDGHRPHAHLGPGVGLFVVNALSERFVVRTVHAGTEATIACARGVIVEPLATRTTTAPSGTTVAFRPDPAIFIYPRVPRAALAQELEDLSFLAPGLELSWSIAGDDVARGGLAARVALGAGCAIDAIAQHRGAYTTDKGPIEVEVALAWVRPRSDLHPPLVESFVNLRRTRDHGSHVDGLYDGVRAIMGAHRRNGLVAIVAVVLADVVYGQPTKSQLVTPEARAPVAEATRAALTAWAARYPEVAERIRRGPEP